MILMWLLLWTMSLTILLADWKLSINRWAASVPFFAGFAGMGIWLSDDVVPFLEIPILKHVLGFMTYFDFSAFQHITPYVMIMYSLRYTGILNKNRSLLRKLTVLLCIPPLIMYMIYPWLNDGRFYFSILSLWVVPYIIFANFLFVYTYFKEKIPEIKKYRLFTMLVVTPATTFAMFANFLLRAFGLNDFWQYNAFTIAFTFVVFIIMAISHGALGVKLKFEKERRDSSMRTIVSGTSVLNHAIKNEISKIALCADNVEDFLDNKEADIEEIKENIGVVKESAGYLSVMVKKIQAQTGNISLVEKDCDLKEIISRALRMQEIYIRQKSVNVKNDINQKLILQCDEIHILEMFQNIISNALEVLDKEGCLDIGIYEDNKFINVFVHDNGPGINEENLPYVFDPFFTTKKHLTNFGLGLSYCYNVMQQHGGDIQIRSQKGIGTTVIVKFPRKRFEMLNSKADTPVLNYKHLWG